MDPVIAVWATLAINLGGVLLMLGAKRQQINDNIRRIDALEECVDELKDEKLAVGDYRREHSDTYKYIGDVDKRAETNTGEVRARIVRLEERAFGSSGRGRS